MSFELASGAEARWTNEGRERAVVCVERRHVGRGGRERGAPRWNGSSGGWPGTRPSSRSSRCATGSSRGGVFESCVEDCASAITAAEETGAGELALLGFSMGGAVAVRNAAAAGVRLVVGVNPWLPTELELEPLRGRRMAIVHGSLDAPLPGIPGVKPSMSRDAAERARALSIDVERTVVPSFHAVALRRRNGGLVALPGSRRVAELVGAELEDFCA